MIAGAQRRFASLLLRFVQLKMSGRPRPSARTFHCQLVEDKLQSLSPAIKNAELRRMFEQCWPNSLDTTVFAHDGDLKEKDHQKARPTTWVITGELAVLAPGPLGKADPPASPSEQATYQLFGCVIRATKWSARFLCISSSH